MSTRFGLSGSVIERIAGVLRRHSAIRLAVIYGSRAKGNFKPGSDIDLSVFGEPGQPVSPRELGLVLDEIDDLLLPYTLDLSAFEQQDNAELQAQIERVGQVFYQHADVSPEPAAPATVEG